MNHLNRIVCINLKERKDKYANVKKVFDKLKIKRNFALPFLNIVLIKKHLSRWIH